MALCCLALSRGDDATSIPPEGPELVPCSWFAPLERHSLAGQLPAAWRIVPDLSGQLSGLSETLKLVGTWCLLTCPPLCVLAVLAAVAFFELPCALELLRLKTGDLPACWPTAGFFQVS